MEIFVLIIFTILFIGFGIVVKDIISHSNLKA